MKLIDKSALVAEIEKKRKDYINSLMTEHIYTLNEVLDLINTLEVKDVDLELITGWFDHIAQIADDRKTANGQKMTDDHALDEIKCLAKNSSEFITKHYRVQKGK